MKTAVMFIQGFKMASDLSVGASIIQLVVRRQCAKCSTIKPIQLTDSKRLPSYYVFYFFLVIATRSLAPGHSLSAASADLASEKKKILFVEEQG